MPRSERTWFQRRISHGYQPLPPLDATAVLVTAAGRSCEVGSEAAAAERLAALPHEALGVLMPTYVARCVGAAHAAAVAHVLDQLEAVRRAYPGVPLTLWLGMQSDDHDGGAAVKRLCRLLAEQIVPDGVTLVGLALPGRGKLRTINAALRVTRSLDYVGWLWLDDDIELAENCLVQLVARFLERGRCGAVGAVETALPGDAAPARVMDAVSHHTTPPYDYPKAACMIVATDVVGGGIPLRRFTDDGYVLFELLSRVSADQPADFDMVPQARYRFYRVGRSGDTLRRLRRSLYSHVTCMADYPWPVAHRYLARHLFYGLWPLAPWDDRRGLRAGSVRWLLKAVHFSWLCLVAAGLLLRGLTRRPLRHVGWGDDGDFRTPLAGAV